MHIIPNVEEGGFLVFDIQGEKVALVTDTSCDLSDEQLARYDISMVSLRVVASTGEFRARTEINQVLGRQRTARQLEAAAAAGIPPLAAVPSAVARTPGGEAGTPPDGAAVRGSGTEGLTGTDIREIREIYPVSGGADVRPKTLSWAFQQDARRYDGGFQLYG